jgi:hypothetical protein
VEHVVRVEAGLEVREPLELLRPVGVADAVFALDAEVVDVDAAAEWCNLVGVQAGAGASGVVFAGSVQLVAAMNSNPAARWPAAVSCSPIRAMAPPRVCSDPVTGAPPPADAVPRPRKASMAASGRSHR